MTPLMPILDIPPSLNVDHVQKEEKERESLLPLIIINDWVK